MTTDSKYQAYIVDHFIRIIFITCILLKMIKFYRRRRRHHHQRCHIIQLNKHTV